MKSFKFYTIFLLIVSVILLLPKNKNPNITYELIKEEKGIYVYYFKEDKLYGVMMEGSNDKFENITLLFSYLTEKSNSVKEEYFTYLNLESKLEGYEVINDDIYLDLSEEFFLVSDNASLFMLSQILYSYKELGYSEVYIKKNGKIVTQMANVIMDGGLVELPVNIKVKNTNDDKKIVRIDYYYNNQTKTFINHVINSNTDETEYKILEIVNFINDNYNLDITYKEYFITPDTLKVKLLLNDNDFKIVQRIFEENFKDIKNINLIH